MFSWTFMTITDLYLNFLTFAWTDRKDRNKKFARFQPVGTVGTIALKGQTEQGAPQSSGWALVNFAFIYMWLIVKYIVTMIVI